ncbi:MAG: DNA-directed RNA polymerase subunit beta [Candidatus Lambdaproteobacteria bacterium RIFOXYD2_FULL_50_16]|uniref:DNA-directed RNA polymerase subunit beta n=1 Tax=Candidatus Lambdaproteobacteria bacterium RIFOXYD2_FULL_50_16 TaxID=1817772 RepID=A0A1F6G836_9PROT|nr:MAG: DNA-directed RNA polymerase subunit beta [Candidatus Lambdaproteobacteria bacterium RIFOXYD2_FULL_50_16]
MTKVPHTQRLRVNFGKIESVLNPPELLQIQKESYAWFLQKEIQPDQREMQGLEAVFKSVFPISDFGGTCTLEYVSYRLGEPKYDENECKIRGVTFAAPIRVSLRLIIWESDEKGDQRRIHDIKEQEIYLGEFPLMTDTGSFIINGTERVIVSQLHKSSGVFFGHDKGKGHSSGKLLYSASIIPQRGSWVDFEFDAKDLLFVRIDRRRKFPATILLKALGFSASELLKRFYPVEKINLKAAMSKDMKKRVYTKYFDTASAQNQRVIEDIVDPADGKLILAKGKKISRASIRKISEAGILEIPSNLEDILGRYSLVDVKGSDGEVIIESNEPLTEEKLEQLLEDKIESIDLLFMGNKTIGPSFRNTLAADKIGSAAEALIEIYKKMKPGDPPTMEVAKNLLQNMFFNAERYDLSQVGRMKINKKLHIEQPLEMTVLTKDDIMAVVEYLLRLKDGAGGDIDDIDHLGNRRVRSVGELLENQVRIGLVRMERAIKERMSLQETETMMLHDIINSKPVSAVINEFFGSSQLSQFMDQTNPLSEITHKRRLSALGPGGLTRERAGFEVRDVHASHYGRICPVETPEGPNIGLISSVATYARLNRFGFIETPYRKVEETKVTDEIVYLSAIDEGHYKIAQANALLDPKNHLVRDYVQARVGGDFKNVRKEDIDFMDVSPKQLVSIAASLIPFLEHDDANRALMGSNMQRQAVPVVRPEAPFVGTGMEYQVAHDSGSCVVARRAGIVDRVDAGRIVVEAEVDLSADESAIEPNVDIYHLRKYQRSNQNTCINQRPLVQVGDPVEVGQILADGGSCESGELALGQNMLIAFMPWNGYNYEDSILVSEKVLHQDRFTSVHIEELEVLARDTKLGKEMITRDIPNVSEHALRNLDDSGIIRIGSYVKSGDILVGKTTPKGETQLNPEEKLLRAIFGEKAGDVRDTSLRVPQGIEGVVIDVKVFNRRGVEKDERTLAIEEATRKKLDADFRDEVRIVKGSFQSKAWPILSKSALAADLVMPSTGEKIFKKGHKLTQEELASIHPEAWVELTVATKSENEQLAKMGKNALGQIELLNQVHESKKEREFRTDDLQPGVIRAIKIYVAMKRRLSVGDKMAGRHGNKGVISRVIPVEEMPYRANGKAIDIVLNPLGVPSRMNVGQVLETHLGLAARALGDRMGDSLQAQHPVNKLKKEIADVYDNKYVSEHLDQLSDEGVMKFAEKLKEGFYFASPVFDGAKEEQIHRLLELCGLDKTGQMDLFDGRTGDKFDQKITVGYLYMLKLHHLVDDKLHARSIGPYSLVTQQPLGGKAQFGGQRFGEMEVWALEAYGAAYTLRELLTVKSDDIQGRNKIYESIVKGNHDIKTGIPESFKVLINELKSLCLDFQLIRDAGFFESEDI